MFFPYPQQENIPKWPQGPGCCLWMCGLDLVELLSLGDFMIPEAERVELLKG